MSIVKKWYDDAIEEINELREKQLLPALDAKFKVWWLRALKGGHFKKGIDKLRDVDNKTCCLGVAADYLVQQGAAEWAVAPAQSGYYIIGGTGNYLPAPFAAKLGIGTRLQRILARVNDQTDDFDTVIAIIEQLPVKEEPTELA